MGKLIDSKPFFRARDVVRARECLNQAVAMEETDPSAAAELYLKALEWDPKNARAHANLGLLAYWRPDLKDALGHFLIAVKLDPDCPEVHYYLGCVQAELGDNRSAVREFKHALKLAPTFAVAHYSIGSLYYTRGQFTDALLHFVTYLNLDPAGFLTDNVALCVRHIRLLSDDYFHDKRIIAFRKR